MNQKLNMLKQILAAFLVFAAIGGFSSCEKYSFTPTVINPVDTIHFQTQIQPIFSANCISCHGAIKAPDLRDGKAYAALIKGNFVTLPGETSKLYTKMIGSEHSPRSSDLDKQRVLVWINQGAHNN